MLQVVWPSAAGALYYYVQSSASADFSTAVTTNVTSPTLFASGQYKLTFAPPGSRQVACTCMHACMLGQQLTISVAML